MAKEVINQIKEVEELCVKAIEDAKVKSETIKSDAKTNTKNYFEQELKKARDDYEKKIMVAEENAKKAIEDAIKMAEDAKKNLASSIKSKQESAIDDIMKELV